VFGNTKEVVTVEAKVEHTGQNAVSPADVGQAHNQIARASAEYEPHGYFIRGTIVTHMNDIEPGADAAAGAIRIIPKDVAIALWNCVRKLLSLYRDHWSLILDDMAARFASAERIRARIPRAGWLVRALDHPDRTVTEAELLAEWPERLTHRRVAASSAVGFGKIWFRCSTVDLSCAQKVGAA